MSRQNARGSWIIILDGFLVGVLPLFMALVMYVSLLTTSPATYLPEFFGTEAYWFLYWYVPAEILAITVCGIFSVALQASYILTLFAAIRAWRGGASGRASLVLLVTAVSLVESAALLLAQYYRLVNTGEAGALSIALITRTLFGVLLVGVNLWYLQTPSEASS